MHLQTDRSENVLHGRAGVEYDGNLGRRRAELSEKQTEDGRSARVGTTAVRDEREGAGRSHRPRPTALHSVLRCELARFLLPAL